MLGCSTDNFHALQIVWDTCISCFMELKRNSWFKFVLCLRKLSTVIHKFKFRIVILAAVILGFRGKRLVHIFWSWGFWFHTAMRRSRRCCFVLGWARPFLIANCPLVYYSEHLNKAVPTSGQFTIFFTLSEQLLGERILQSLCSSILCLKSWRYKDECRKATG